MIAPQVRVLRDAADRLVRAVQKHFDEPHFRHPGVGGVPPDIEGAVRRVASAVFDVDAEMARDGSGRFITARPSGSYLNAGAQTVLAKAILSAVVHARDPAGMDPERDWEEASKSGTRCVDTLKLAGYVLRAVRRLDGDVQLGRRVV